MQHFFRLRWLVGLFIVWHAATGCRPLEESAAEPGFVPARTIAELRARHPGLGYADPAGEAALAPDTIAMIDQFLTGWEKGEYVIKRDTFPSYTTYTVHPPSEYPGNARSDAQSSPPHTSMVEHIQAGSWSVSPLPPGKIDYKIKYYADYTFDPCARKILSVTNAGSYLYSYGVSLLDAKLSWTHRNHSVRYIEGGNSVVITVEGSLRLDIQGKGEREETHSTALTAKSDVEPCVESPLPPTAR